MLIYGGGVQIEIYKGISRSMHTAVIVTVVCITGTNKQLCILLVASLVTTCTRN